MGEMGLEEGFKLGGGGGFGLRDGGSGLKDAGVESNINGDHPAPGRPPVSPARVRGRTKSEHRPQGQVKGLLSIPILDRDFDPNSSAVPQLPLPIRLNADTDSSPRTTIDLSDRERHSEDFYTSSPGTLSSPARLRLQPRTHAPASSSSSSAFSGVTRIKPPSVSPELAESTASLYSTDSTPPPPPPPKSKPVISRLQTPSSPVTSRFQSPSSPVTARHQPQPPSPPINARLQFPSSPLSSHLQLQPPASPITSRLQPPVSPVTSRLQPPASPVTSRFRPPHSPSPSPVPASPAPSVNATPRTLRRFWSRAKLNVSGSVPSGDEGGGGAASPASPSTRAGGLLRAPLLRPFRGSQSSSGLSSGWTGRGDVDVDGEHGGRIEEEQRMERGSLALQRDSVNGEDQDLDHPWVGMGRVAAFEERLGLGHEARTEAGAGESTQSLPLDRVGNGHGHGCTRSHDHGQNGSTPDLSSGGGNGGGFGFGHALSTHIPIPISTSTSTSTNPGLGRYRLSSAVGDGSYDSQTGDGRDLDGHGGLAPPPQIQMHNEDEGTFQDSILSTMIEFEIDSFLWSLQYDRPNSIRRPRTSRINLPLPPFTRTPQSNIQPQTPRSNIPPLTRPPQPNSNPPAPTRPSPSRPTRSPHSTSRSGRARITGRGSRRGETSGGWRGSGRRWGGVGGGKGRMMGWGVSRISLRCFFAVLRVLRFVFSSCSVMGHHGVIGHLLYIEGHHAPNFDSGV